MIRHIVLFGLLTSSHVMADELEFFRDVYPFLKTNCIACHNKTTTKADLNMETPELMIKGGDSGPSIVPGKSDESLIVKASLHKDDIEMPPPNNKSGAVNLSAAEIAILKRWIDQGAKSVSKEERSIALKAYSASVDPIYSVAMTKDGRYAACGRSNQIFLYDLATRQLLTKISDPNEKNGAAHRALVQSLSFSPDGSRLASGSFREVKIWKLEEVKPTSHTSNPASIPINEKLLAKIIAAGKLKAISSTMSADGKKVAIGCDDGAIRVWDVASLKEVIELRGSVQVNRKMADIDWTIAEQTLEEAFQRSEITRIQAQDKALDLLLAKAKEAISNMKKVLPEKQKAVPATTKARADAQAVVDQLLAKLDELKDSAVDKELKTAQDKLITTKMAEDSALAAVKAAEGNIKDAEGDVKRITMSKAANTKIIAVANDAISKTKDAKDKAATALAELKKSLSQSTVKPMTICFSDDAQRVASMMDDGTLRVWAVASGLPIEETSGNDASMTITTASDGSFVATKTVKLTTGSTPSWSLERTLDQKGLFADRVNAVRFSPDGKTLATGGGEPSRSGDLILFDVATGQATRTWKEKHTDAVLCLDFSPDGKLFASGAADKLTLVTEVSTAKQVNAFEGHTHHVMGVAFRSDGRVLATAGAEGTVVAWNMLIGERKKKIEGWTKEVTSLQFIGATNQIITSSGDNRVRIITDDGSEVRSIANIPDYMQSAVSAPNGNTIVGGGEDSLLRIWDATGKELVAFGKD